MAVSYLHRCSELNGLLTKRLVGSRGNVTPRRIMQLPSGQDIRIPQLDHVHDPIDQVQLALHEMTRYIVQLDATVPRLGRLNDDVPGIVAWVYSRIGQRLIFVLVTKEDTDDLVFFGVGEELMS